MALHFLGFPDTMVPTTIQVEDEYFVQLLGPCRKVGWIFEGVGKPTAYSEI